MVVTLSLSIRKFYVRVSNQSAQQFGARLCNIITRQICVSLQNATERVQN